MSRRPLGLGLAALALLATVLQVHASGQALLASTLLAVGMLALWTYGSARTQALRYLFPGIAAALVFVVFPMLYTVGMGFTNTSSRNLLTREQALTVLLAEQVPVVGSSRAFTLHRDGHALRIALAGSPGWWSAPVPAGGGVVPLQPLAGEPPSPALPLREVVAQLPLLRKVHLQGPEPLPWRLAGLRSMHQARPLYQQAPDGSLTQGVTGVRYLPQADTGFYTSAEGDTLAPGYRVGVGLAHYQRLFSDARFREPFLGVLVWTVMFAALSVAGAAVLGLTLSVLLNWPRLRGRGVYRLVLFLPYAVPGFISILVFKGLFNQNLGEINLILHGLFGIRPAWFSDPTLARVMLLVVNIWLGFPYMMVLCSGLIQSIPADLYEASAVAGAGPWTNFRRITAPLIVRPLTPLLISAFAFNFNNFVLISLLTGGRPDQLDTTLPAGTTDILVSYTWRIAFQDTGQQFGLAAAISTVIFVIVAAVTLLQLRLTRKAQGDV